MCRPRFCKEEINQTLGQAFQQVIAFLPTIIALSLSACLFLTPSFKSVLSLSLFRHIGRPSLKISALSLICALIRKSHIAKRRLAPSMFYITLV